MNRALLVLAVILLPSVLYAVGTKEKKQKIYVRREFVAITQVEEPVEFHSAHDTFHSLRCKRTGMEKCGWKREPLLGKNDPSLASIDKMVATSVGMFGGGRGVGPGLIEVDQRITIYYKPLANGYEYTIEEGIGPNPTRDSVMQSIQKQVRKNSRKHTAVFKL